MKDNPRLLYIMYDRPNHPSGPIVNLRRVLPKLVEKGYEIYLISFSQTPESPNANYLKDQGVIVSIYDKKQSTKSKTQIILKEAESIQPDIFVPDVSTSACFATKWLHESNIYSVNSHRSDDELNWGKAIYFSDKKYNYCTTAIFCVSSYLEGRLKERVSELGVKTTVIPSGVIVPEYSCIQEGDKIKVVYAGRMVRKQKQIVETVQLAIAACRELPFVEFTFVGDGSQLEECVEIVNKAGLAGRIKFTGVLYDEDYKRELSKHHVILLLSDYEGIPGSVMDGMSCGLIPVVNNYPGVGDLVTKNEGFIINRNEEELIDALNRIYSNLEFRVQLGYAARQRIINRFSIDYAVKKWEELISDLLNLGEKTKFIAPKEIKLPPQSELLKEYTKDSRYSWVKKLRSKLRIRSRLKAVFQGN